MTLFALFAILTCAQEGLPESAVLRLSGHTDGVRAVDWSADGKFILTGSRDRTLGLWNAATGERIRTFEGHEGGVTSAAFSPDGRWVVSGSQDKSVALWDLRTGKEVRRMNGHSLWVSCVAFSPDSKRVISGSLDHTAILWDTATGSSLFTLAGHGDRIEGAAFSPDGKHVLTASGDKCVILWETETGARQERFVAEDAVLSVAMTPLGTHVLAGTWPGAVYRWEVKGKEDVAIFKGHVGNVNSVAVSPDGLTYASSCADESVIVGGVEKGKRLARFFGHRGRVWSVAWSPGGRRVVSGAEDGTALVWDPWPRASQGAREWASSWAALKTEERTAALRSLLLGLKSSDAAGLAEARERILALGEEAVEPILRTFKPGLLGSDIPEEKLRRLLGELDNDSFETRIKAKKDLTALGRGVLPWIEQQLRQGKDLSPEVRGSLEDVRQRLRSTAEAASADDGRGRAVRILLEMPASREVMRALKLYAEGPDEAPATKAARAAVKP
jgi:hypothetical protein